MWDGRATDLLLRSLALASTGAALALLMGLFAAFFLWRARRAAWFTAILFFALPLPSMAYASAWQYVSRALALKIAPEFSVVVVYGSMMTPLASLALYKGFLRISEIEISAARLMRPDWVCLFRIVIRQNRPMMLAVFLFAGLMNLLDYTVPSLFGISVYTLDIFAMFSATGDAPGALIRSIPILIVSLTLLTLMFWQMLSIWSVNPQGNGGGCLSGQGNIFKVFGGLGFLVCLLPLIIIGLALLPLFTSPKIFLAAIKASLQELGYSLFLSATAAMAGTALAFVVSRLKSGFILGALAFAAMPPALIGIGLLYVLSPLNIFDAAMPVIALVLRFFPFAAIVLYIAQKTESREEKWAAQLFSPNRLHWLMRYKIPVMRPSLLISATIIFAFSLGELGATLLVIPPGRTTLTIKLYNYLHYGSNPAVSGLTCLLGAATLLTMTVAWRYKRFWSGGAYDQSS